MDRIADEKPTFPDSNQRSMSDSVIWHSLEAAFRFTPVLSPAALPFKEERLPIPTSFLDANRLPLSSRVKSKRLTKLGIRCLLQLGIFRSGLFENRDVGIGVFPESKEIPVGSFGLGIFA